MPPRSRSAGRGTAGVALLELVAHKARYVGAAASAAVLPGLKPVAEWAACNDSWQHALVALMQQHLSGEATLTRDPAVCRRCHLPALCRRAGDDAADAEVSVTGDG